MGIAFRWRVITHRIGFDSSLKLVEGTPTQPCGLVFRALSTATTPRIAEELESRGRAKGEEWRKRLI